MFKETGYRSGFKIGVILAIIFYCLDAASVTRVAVIDSGYNKTPDIQLCEDGHYDFLTKQPIIGYDNIGHGTEIARIIANEANKDYCLVIYRVFAKGIKTGDAVPRAIRKAIADKISIINMSYSGSELDVEEYREMWSAGEMGIKMFVAAGNNDQNLDDTCDIYPACYAIIRMTVVGSKNAYDDSNMSNVGKVIDQEEDYCYGMMCGTSVSAAIATGKYLRSLSGNNK